MSNVLQKKLVEGFTVADLSDYVKGRVKSNAKVCPLKKDEWVEVGNYKIFLLDTTSTSECDLVRVLVAKRRGDTGEHVVVGEPVIAADWNMIPGTNLFFDMWFAGDSTPGVPLVVEQYTIEQTVLEDFLGTGTNLSAVELGRIAKAILEKKVEWDKGKTNLVGEGCSAEFVFEGRRYKYEEVVETPTGLYLISKWF